MKERYIEAVKTHTISPIAAMFGKYLLFCDSDEEVVKNICFVMKLLL